MNYEENKIYFAKCKKDTVSKHSKGQIIPCIKKVFQGTGDIVWHTDGPGYDSLGFSWSDFMFKDEFEEPFELKPGMKVKLKSYDDCKGKEKLGFGWRGDFFGFGTTMLVNLCDEVNGTFRGENGFFYSNEWIEEVVELSEENTKSLADVLQEEFLWHPEQGMIEKPSWSFTSDKINWELVCMDLMEEDTPLAFITNNDKHYIIGIWSDVFDWQEIFSKYMINDFLDCHNTHDIFEVSDPEECKKLVKEFTKRYKQAHKNKRRKVLNRTKKLKTTKSFNVFTY